MSEPMLEGHKAGCNQKSNENGLQPMYSLRQKLSISEQKEMWENMPWHAFVFAALPLSKTVSGWMTSWAPDRFCFCCKPEIFGKNASGACPACASSSSFNSRNQHWRQTDCQPMKAKNAVALQRCSAAVLLCCCGVVALWRCSRWQHGSTAPSTL